MICNCYSYNTYKHGYFKIRKNGIPEHELNHYYDQWQVWDIHCDYGTKDENLLQLLGRIGEFHSLYIYRLNDLGYLVSDVLDNLETLKDRNVRVFVNGREIDLIITYDSIEYHFRTYQFVNFDKYDKAPIFKDDLEGEII